MILRMQPLKNKKKELLDFSVDDVLLFVYIILLFVVVNARHRAPGGASKAKNIIIELK